MLTTMGKAGPHMELSMPLAGAGLFHKENEEAQ